MKNSYKLALLTVLGLATASAVQAQNDLVVGIYQPGSANTTTLDLGLDGVPASGQTWDLTSSLSAAGISSVTSAGQFGVIGDDQLAPNNSGRVVYVTDVGTPNHVVGQSQWNNVDTAASSITIGTAPVGSSFSWDTEINPNKPNTVAAALGEDIGTGVSSQLDLWTVDANNDAPVLDGYFTFNTTSDILTFDTVSVPEPTTYGLLAGAGLLIVSLRNQFSRKQA
jgi:hypothetical protein